jgi:DNA helicase II / ATP-dependent DNA helicase PcrA
MPISNKHHQYEEEINRLDDTLSYVEDAITASEKIKTMRDEDIRAAYAELDFLDSSQSYVTILVNTMLMEELEKNFYHLLKARKKPYFARIDFRETGSSNTDKLYIGRMSLTRSGWDIPFIVDWRAPITSVYYDGRLGDVSYQTTSDIVDETIRETVTGELFLKRQYNINDAKLEDIIDVDITATDTFLQASLEGNASNRLQDIVSTIQAEQNAIIRSDIDKPLIVQGVAGSGKTTIALHRIAYLIYTYEKNFFPEQFMIIAPNRLFLNYISEVLPELGVDKVKQTTFIDFIFELIGKKYKLLNPDEKLISIINMPNENSNTATGDMLKKASAFKGSMLFKNIIERYIRQTEETFVPAADFILEGYKFLSASEIKKLFIEDYKYLPFYKRIDEIKKHFTNHLKANKNKILEQIEHHYDKQIEHLRCYRKESEERRLKIVDLIDKRDNAVNAIRKSSRTLISKFIAKFPKLDLFDYYKELVTNAQNLELLGKGNLKTEVATYVAKQSEKLFASNHIELEDLSALAYLKHRIFGFDKAIDIKYVVIDEAQDFSHFQFFVLKEILNTQLFTILGDLSQGIHSYRGIKNWNFVLEKIFDPKKSKYLTLEQSYRTTIEIMDMANEIIKQCPVDDLVLAKPVVRHGEKPSIFTLDTPDAIMQQVKERINSLKNEGYGSIALIGKTLNECKDIKKYLDKDKKIKCTLLDDKESAYNNDIVIVPSYLAKGLEFDAVIIINIQDTYTTDELDLKLLYVAMTRALHRMYIYCLNHKIPVLESSVYSDAKTPYAR